MTETVRVVSDGEELVLSHGEVFRIHPSPAPEPAAPAAPRKAAAAPQVQYLGFQDTPERREYALRVQRADDSRRYTVWIPQAAFAKREALRQDGPDICFQKLLRELMGGAPPESDCIAVTEADLTQYRETHAPPARRGFSAALPASKPKSDE